LNGTRQFLVYVENVNMMGKNTNTIKKSTEVLLRDIHKKTLSADYIWGMLATIMFRIFCPFVS